MYVQYVKCSQIGGNQSHVPIGRRVESILEMAERCIGSNVLLNRTLNPSCPITFLIFNGVFAGKVSKAEIEFIPYAIFNLDCLLRLMLRSTGWNHNILAW